jgi:hypothetical protein
MEEYQSLFFLRFASIRDDGFIGDCPPWMPALSRAKYDNPVREWMPDLSRESFNNQASGKLLPEGSCLLIEVCFVLIVYWLTKLKNC